MKHEPRSCASCDELACGMHQGFRQLDAPSERVAWVLDAVWPETASVVAASFGMNDQLISPGFLGWPRRYGWPRRSASMDLLATARRHWAMHRVGKAPGRVRQLAYLQADRRIALKLSRSIDYRARHLIVAQSWLPWLDEAGALGGRTFDVMMSRYPYAEIHRLLDQAASELGGSRTIADFRAPADLVELESALLSRAQRIYSPHDGIAGLFPRQAVRLAWHMPSAKSRRPGNRVAFLGPTIARQRPDIARALAVGLKHRLVVFGPILEPLWDGLPIERREWGPRWLDGIGAILHPATMTHEPRALLEARASGVAVYATPTCGLSASEYLPLDQFPCDLKSGNF